MTTPLVTTVVPASGESAPVPWICAIVAGSGSGSGSGSPPLTAPNVFASGPVQAPWTFCRDCPTGVELASETPMSTAAMPFAGPPTAVMPPS